MNAINTIKTKNARKDITEKQIKYGITKRAPDGSFYV